MKKRMLALALTFVMALSLLPTAAFAAGTRYSDTAGHWAESSIERWSQYKIVEGENGSFHPDRSLTRGEMAKILANTLGLTKEGEENPFADVPADAWYTPYVLRCAVAGIMEGDGVNAKPSDLITRQEAMVMLCRALVIAEQADAELSAYTDSSDVAPWAKGAVAAMVEGKIVNGVGGSRLAPLDHIDRASIMAILDRTIAQYINTSGSHALTDKAGMVLVAAGDVTLTGKTPADILVTAAATGKALTFDGAQVTGSVTVQADNVTVVNQNNSTLPQITALGTGLKTETAQQPVTSGGGSSGGSHTPTPTYSNLTVAEPKTVDGNGENATKTYRDVTITDAVGDGTVTLSNMTILGNLYINGGGSSTVNLENVVIHGRIIINKTEGETPRLHLTNTPVTTVEVEKPAIIEAADAASAVTTVQAKADVEIRGENTAVTTLAIPSDTASTVDVTVTDGTVAKVDAKGEATVTGAAGAVKEVVAQAPVTVSAETVGKVEIPATAPENMTVAVTGTGSLDVEINSDKGVSVTTVADAEGNKATVEVSSELETPPENITVDGEAVEHIHRFDNGVITVEPVCEKDGIKVFTCVAENCDADETQEGDQPMTRQEFIPPLGHDWGEWEPAGEHDYDGHSRVCTRDSSHVQNEIHAFHNIGEWVYVDADTCKNVCDICGFSESAPHERKSGTEIKPTCTEAGEKPGVTCERCSTALVKSEVIPALGHDFTGSYTSDETNHWHKCSRCEETDAKAAHTYPAGASCDSASQCTVCGNEKPAGTHAWSDWTKADDANHKHTCSVCKTVETVPHTWDNGVVTKEPTETEDGVKTFTCADCKATKTETVLFIPPTPVPEGAPYLTVGIDNVGEQYAQVHFKLDGVTPLEGKSTLEGIAEEVTLAIGGVTLMSHNGEYVYYRNNEYSLSTVWFSSEIEKMEEVGDTLTGLTVTLTPADGVTLSQTELTNDTFRLEIRDAAPMDQSGYQAEYSETDDRIYITNLPKAAMYYSVFCYSVTTGNLGGWGNLYPDYDNPNGEETPRFIQLDSNYTTYEYMRDQFVFLHNASLAVNGNTAVISKGVAKFSPVYGRQLLGATDSDLPVATVEFSPYADATASSPSRRAGLIWRVETDQSISVSVDYESETKTLTHYTMGQLVDGSVEDHLDVLSQYADGKVGFDQPIYFGGYLRGIVNGARAPVAKGPWLKTCLTKGAPVDLKKTSNSYLDQETGERIYNYRQEEPFPAGYSYWSSENGTTGGGGGSLWLDMTKKDPPLIVWQWDGKLIPDADGTLCINVTYFDQFNFVED